MQSQLNSLGQQYALQQQLSLLQGNAFLNQLNAAPQAAVLAQLNGLQQQALQLQLNGQLTSSRLKDLRKQQTALTKQLRALRNKGTSSQMSQ